MHGSGAALTREPSLELIEKVRGPVNRHVRRTPLLRSDWLSDVTGAEVFLKCKNLQLTGSFKVRVAVAARACRPEAAKALVDKPPVAHDEQPSVPWPLDPFTPQPLASSPPSHAIRLRASIRRCCPSRCKPSIPVPPPASVE